MQLGYATMVQKRRLTGRSGRRRRDVAPLETEATAGLFGAYFGHRARVGVNLHAIEQTQ